MAFQAAGVIYPSTKLPEGDEIKRRECLVHSEILCVDEIPLASVKEYLDEQR